LQQHQLDCSTRLLYQHSTVRKLAQHLQFSALQTLNYVAVDSTELNEMQKLMISHQLITSPVIYNENISIDFNGMPLTEPQLQQALSRFVSHHPVLRMQVLDDYQHFIVSAMPETGIALHTEHFTSAQFDAGYKQSLKQWINLPFSLQQGPLYRFVLFYRDNQPVKLAFIHHHLISDGDAMYNLFVPQLYALLKDISTVLPAYPLQFSRPAAHADLSALISQMQRVDLFHSRPSADCVGDYLAVQFSEPQTRQLESLARLHNVSLYAVLQSVLAVLIYKFSGQKQFSMGGVKSLRGADAEAIYGNFLVNDIQNLVLDPAQGFADRVKQGFAEIQQSLDQIIPYPLLLEQLRQQSGLDEKLPGIYMTLEPKAKFQLGWQVTQNDTLPHAVKYPLYFEFDHQRQLLLRLEFRTAMYSKTQAQQLLTGFQLLLDQVLQHAETPVHQLQVMPPQRIRDLLLPATFQTERQTEQPAQTLVQLWQRAADQFPARTALNCADESLTYRQLDEQANQLAQLIRQQIEVKADTLIALLLPRSLDTVLAILAVLKAGAAYVPIETSYPADRIAFIL
ncbi:MAG: AMP-binding protein, partial [Pararheinheimera sp.]|nr:AMP-binding protein [Rheinheimera sp.]